MSEYIITTKNIQDLLELIEEICVQTSAHFRANDEDYYTDKINDILVEITQREVAIAEPVPTDNDAQQNHPEASSQISGDTD